MNFFIGAITTIDFFMKGVYDLSAILGTNLSAVWEPLKKHVSLSLALNNIFRASDPAPARSAFLTLECRL